MDRLIEIKSSTDIPKKYLSTPIGLLVEYQNHIRAHDSYACAQILAGMCMDNRKALDVPENFAYILRTGGANMRASGFKISYAIAAGGVRYIVIAGHDHCGMVNLMQRKEAFISGLVEGAGWNRQKAEDHFLNLVPMFEIGIESNHLCFIRE